MEGWEGLIWRGLRLPYGGVCGSEAFIWRGLRGLRLSYGGV